MIVKKRLSQSQSLILTIYFYIIQGYSIIRYINFYQSLLKSKSNSGLINKNFKY